MRRFAVISMMVFGVALILLGASWKWIFPPKSYWTEDQAKQYQEAFNAVHAAEDAHGARGEVSSDFIAARQRYDRLKGELEQARVSRSRTGQYLAATGLILLLAGEGLRRVSPDSAE